MLAKEIDALAPWPDRPELLVVDAVAREARRGSGLVQQRTQLVDGDATRGIAAWLAVRPLPLSGEALDALMHLRPTDVAADKNLGEDASIALAATLEREAIFVTRDKVAAFVALAELGPGRVSTPFDVWVDLQQHGMIDAACARRLHEATCRALHQIGGGRLSRFSVPRRI
ncbi:MAG: hypothetical protein H6747_13910 [Deltaproteobacteria bacterium]|nr:hypothetical protein [Deltaproteobacteria bacterium]